MSAPSFDIEGRDWPNRQASRFVKADGIVFHVQICGSGPVLLLVHGTGAATHTWRDMVPALSSHFSIVALDLPGHGFSEKPDDSRLSLSGMAHSLRALLREIDMAPVLAAGHSAGAAVLAQMSLAGHLDVRSIISINGALLPLAGIPGSIFSPIAKLLVKSPFVPNIAAKRARSTSAVSRLIEGTGSTIDPEGIEYYRRILSTSRHTSAALAMMANWQLQPLERDLPRLQPHLVVVSTSRDRAIAPSDGRRVCAMVPNATWISLDGPGHLAHEEDPEHFVQIILDEAERQQVLKSVA